jgi:hypothetical protein
MLKMIIPVSGLFQETHFIDTIFKNFTTQIFNGEKQT